jgi:dienelactone hydrolase
MTPPTRRRFLAQSAIAASLAQSGVALGQETPRGMPADIPRELAPTQADLGTLYADLNRLAGDAPFPLSYLNDRFRDHAAYRAEAKAKVLDVLLHRPAPVEPRAEVIERVELDDHIREKVVFSTTPQFRVPAYVLIPKNLTGRAPAIVDLHSHGGMFLFGKEKVIDFGRNHPAMTTYHEANYDGRPTATALVRRGYVVITIDAFYFGERRLMLDADRERGWDRTRYTVDDVRALNLVCRGNEGTLAKSMVFAGATWPGVVAWDDMRTVDYLVTRPEVDPRKIGCLGISMGGYRTMYLAALDDRIQAACVAGFMSTIRPMLRSHVDRHSWVHYLPELHRHLDWPDLAALAAPRALMVLQCSQDRLFPMAGMRESIEKIGAVYAKANVRDRFAGRFHDVPHKFTRAMQDEAFDWLDRHLRR